MNEFLQVIVDFLAVLFGDTPSRPRTPRPLPPALPPAPPPTPQANPEEPQDAGDVKEDDFIVISHEAEPPRVGEGAPEFDENPLPAPEDDPIPPVSPDDRVIIPVPVPPAPEYRARYMWCIDNGHGALTAGKRSPILPDGRQLLEYQFNRDITRRIFAQLDAIGVAYFNVVPETQVGNFLTERVDRANRLSTALPKLFVSIHGNAGPAPTLQDFTDDSVQGVETWYYNGSTKGRKMATIFHRNIIAQTDMNNRHLRSKVTGQFYVLRATRMPAVLTENGFYNNRFDLEQMLTEDFRQRVADAHVAAIMEIEREGL
ncbi:N-acetylmuramoyl-L-alanine amidase [Lewinella sp. W8]|uniref:N-acetylmuramoyl-L-alanine amidase n=1 Tax=Lewinella sp. W8 TaxID=2528208 RepID=UPI0010680F2C|nr:N-acetylmuramoyl-L-alanine amidase [Lewinella sp. W8]MTB51558.1 hypothetical protein [Lewinella sp. W8]